LKEDAKLFLSVLKRNPVWPPPIWLMRQAGRYLPEYRELRSKAGSFWAMCMNPELAAEITLQPIRRFGFNAAIIFSDILTVLYALGREVRFSEGTGPALEPVRSVEELDRDPVVWRQRLAPAYETIARVRSALPRETTLLGFAGAPWTLATYMAAGRGGDEQRAAKLWGYREPERFGQMLDLIGNCVAAHLIMQLQAGAEAVQIFDSWASGLPEGAYSSWVIQPTRRIVKQIRHVHPEAKIIGFPRASTLAGYRLYAEETGVDALSVDTSAPWSWMADLAGATAVQGNLDPLLLVAGGEAMRQAAEGILAAMRGEPFIFNLGHGVLPETPPEHVTELMRIVRTAQ